MAEKSFITYPAVRPLAWIYGRIMRVRNRRFDTGRTPITAVSVPVISVGNLSVGGTGKTPMCRWLLGVLTEQGLKPAMLSRGYGRNTQGFRHVDTSSTADEVGDEPLEVFNAFDGKVPVFVCEDRVHGAQRMLQHDRSINVIVLDDAYQHRFLHRDINILLTDYSRLYTRDRVIPEGRLRELPEGAARADIIIVTKCPADLGREEADALTRELKPRERQQVFFSAIKYEPLDTDLSDKRLLIFTGIANPRPLVSHYDGKGLSMETLQFADHHRFTDRDINKVATAADKADIVITTAKDYSRLPKDIPDSLRSKLHVQRIGVEILLGQEEEVRKTISKLSTHTPSPGSGH